MPRNPISLCSFAVVVIVVAVEYFYRIEDVLRARLGCNRIARCYGSSLFAREKCGERGNEKDEEIE